MAGISYCSKSKHKAQLRLFSIENAEIRYAWDFNVVKMLK